MIILGDLTIDIARFELRSNGATVPIGSRAFSILAALIAAEGRVVSKAEMMRSVWPDTVVEVNNIHVHIAALRRALGTHRDRLKTIAGRGYQFVSASAAQEPGLGSSAVTAPYIAERSKHADSTCLVGRAACLESIGRALNAHRLVTLVGAGGVGKTALAIALAAHARENSALRVRLVELAAVHSPADVLPFIATTSVPVLDTPSYASLAHSLSETIDLLILDNAEHVIDEVATLAETLINLEPNLRILVTSRERLRTPAEHVVPIEPLETPGANATIDEIALTPAVQLFLLQSARWRSVRAPTPYELTYIGELCRRLDGLPLAIELAAATANTLGVKVIHDHLDERLNMLAGSGRTAPARHQTLRATFDWSYALLCPSSRILFRRMAVFRGAFSLESLCTVVCDEMLSLGSVIEAIGDLVDKSLLRLEFAGQVVRYRLPESTRSYASDRLVNEGEALTMQDRRARCIADVIDNHVDGANTRSDNTVGVDLDDLRAASDWALSADGDHKLGIQLTAALSDALIKHGKITESARRAAVALKTLKCDTPEANTSDDGMRLRAALALALPHTCGSPSIAGALWNEVIDIARQGDHSAFIAQGHWGRWNAEMFAGAIEAALRVASGLKTEAERRRCAWQVTLADTMAAVSLHCNGQHRLARAHAESVLERLQSHPTEIDDIKAVASDPRAVCYSVLARILWVEARPEAEIMEMVERAINLIHPVTMEPWLTHVLGVVAAPMALFCENLRAGSNYVQILRSQSAQHEFDTWLDYADCLSGLELTLKGDFDAGIAALRLGLDRLYDYGFRRFTTPFEAAHADALLRTGHALQATRCLLALRDYCREQGDLFILPEVYRLLALSAFAQTGDTAQARQDLWAAIDIACAHGARHFELRARDSLATLDIKQPSIACAPTAVR